MYGILYWIIGYLKLEITGENALSAINALHSEGFSFSKLRPVEGGYTINCTVFAADGIIERLEKLDVCFNVAERKGISFMGTAYLHRPGLLVGLLVGLLIVFGSTRLVWDVRVECGEEYDEKAVLSSLKELGVYTGASLHSIDVYETELTFLMKNPSYSKIIINLQGTVAAVELKPRDRVEHKEQKDGAYDIVASEAGVIHSVTATKGEPAVKEGNTVAAGDVLISGTVQGVRGAYYMYRAEGSVTATVYREYTVIIPLETTEKVYTGNKETKTAYTVLGAELDMFADESPSFVYSDAVTKTEKTELWGLKLPIVKETVTYKEYRLESVTITEECAKEKALSAFNAYLEREVVGEIVNTEVENIYSEELGAVILSATAEVITEIGVEQQITVFPEEKEAD